MKEILGRDPGSGKIVRSRVRHAAREEDRRSARTRSRQGGGWRRREARQIRVFQRRQRGPGRALDGGPGRRLDDLDARIRHSDAQAAARSADLDLAVRQGHAGPPRRPARRNVRGDPQPRAAGLQDLHAQQALDHGVEIRAGGGHERVPSLAHSLRGQQLLDQPGEVLVLERRRAALEQMHAAFDVADAESGPRLDRVPPRPHFVVVIVVLVDVGHRRHDGD